MNGRRKRSGEKVRDPMIDAMLSKRPHLWDLDDTLEPITHAVQVGEGEPLIIEDLD